MAEKMSLTERQAALQEIADRVRQCTLCPLSTGRTNAVPGAGRVNAEIMFVGEAPGFYEDQQGLPFVGASGKYLDELLGKIGLTRDEVFITNVVKCRPPGNRDPLPDEIDICVSTYLKQQVEIIQPKLIATLGRFSMALFFPKDARITKIHGHPLRANNRVYYPLFHPAAVLRNPNLRPAMEADFRRISELIAEIAQSSRPDTPDEPPPPPQQLSLF